MNRRKTAATVVIATIAAIGLTLPGTAAARGYVPPIGVQNPAAVVDVSGMTAASTETVSWGDAVEVVSWGD
jgi:hypothetical protein